jgi:DNA-binding NarL/FixJ family response regulator
MGETHAILREQARVDHRVSVYVNASDPISATGIKAQLNVRSDILLVDEPGSQHAQVAIIVADESDAESARRIRSALCEGTRRVVLVVTRLDDGGLLSAVEAGASGILRRSEADSDRLVEAVTTAANGDGSVPRDLLGRLLDQVSRFQRQVLTRRGISLSGFTEREIDVLRLLSEGWDTTEIAGKMCYSERTVKNAIHDILVRHQLRNRPHAVAYAVRAGII